MNVQPLNIFNTFINDLLSSVQNTQLTCKRSARVTFELCVEFNSNSYSNTIMEWMICNSCWVKMETQQQPFHLTQCGHIYCAKCVVKAVDRCFQCGTTNTISLSLKEPLSPQIEHYFQRPADLIDKALGASKFQEAQLSLCLQRGDAADSKYQSLKEAYWKNNETLKRATEKYTRLKMLALAMQKEQRKKAESVDYTPSPSMMRTPMNQVRNHEHNRMHHSRNHHRDGSMSNEGVFRVPTVTRVPRSAGYFSATSSSSSSRQTPGSSYSSSYAASK